MKRLQIFKGFVAIEAEGENPKERLVYPSQPDWWADFKNDEALLREIKDRSAIGYFCKIVNPAP